MYEYRADLIRCIDGDTVELSVDLGFSIHMKRTFRLVGVDAAELRGVERPLGLKHKAILEGLLERFKEAGGGSLTIRTTKDTADKYGRYLFDAVLTNTVPHALLSQEFLRLADEHPEP